MLTISCSEVGLLGVGRIIRVLTQVADPFIQWFSEKGLHHQNKFSPLPFSSFHLPDRQVNFYLKVLNYELK